MDKLAKLNSRISADVIALTIYTLHIALNFLQFSGLKHFYIISVGVFFGLAFIKRWEELLVTTFVLLFIEGQGRVITNYNLFFRNVFDVFLVLIMLRAFIREKRLFVLGKIPQFFIVMFLCHFVWYGVQFFNYRNVGVAGVLFASKIYVFPILMFFFFLLEPFKMTEERGKRLIASCVYLIILQVALIFFQHSQGDAGLIRLSGYYAKIMSDKFIGLLFRPFGTSFVPGGMAIPFAYTSAVLFLMNTNSKLLSFFKVIAIVGMLAACIIMQVRTGLIQLFLIVFAINFIRGITSKAKIFVLSTCMLLVYLTPIGLQNAHKLQEYFPEMDLGYAIYRLQSLGDMKAMSSSRASPTVVFDALLDKLSRTPLGLGPGRTGAANRMFVNKIKNDLEYDMQYSWTHDNLFVSLAIDFGWGMIFYSLVVLLLPIYIGFQTVLDFYKKRKIDILLLSCCITSGIILLSNWGAIAIPYNPASFFFWFFVAMALNHLNRSIPEKNLL